METTSQSTNREDRDEEWNEYAPFETATYIIAHGRETGDNGERKVIVESAEPFVGQRVVDMVGIAVQSAEPRVRRQEVRKTCLHSFFYRRVSRGDVVVK